MTKPGTLIGLSMIFIGLTTLADITRAGGISIIFDIGCPLFAAWVLWGPSRREKQMSLLAAITILIGFNATRFDLGIFTTAGVLVCGGLTLILLGWSVPAGKQPSGAKRIGYTVFWVVFALLVATALLIPLVTRSLGH